MGFLTDNVTIYVQMLRAFVEDGVGRNVESALIVIIKSSRLSALDMKIPQKVDQPLELTCSRGQGTILCFS